MQTIYALFDPRHPEVVRYVGKTKNYLAQRLAGHIIQTSKEKKKRGVAGWVMGLMMIGLVPGIRALQVVDDTDVDKAETEWIKALRPSGLLLNISDGRGLHGLGGCRLTVAARAAIRYTQKLRQTPIVCVETGIEYESIKAAATSVGAFPSNISEALIKGWRVRGKRFAYVVQSRRRESVK